LTSSRRASRSSSTRTTNLLEEIAKFRAARRLWARIMRERFHARDPRSLMLRFHTQTAGSSLTAQQPEVNVVRTTIQALAAVLAARSRCTQTRWTKRWRCRPKPPRESPCARNR
jgi:methylmalonyl-CoA mutase N-terminal domain/subunit